MSRRPWFVSDLQGYLEKRRPSPVCLAHATPVSVSYEQQSLRVLVLALLLLMDSRCRKTRRNRWAASLILSWVSPLSIAMMSYPPNGYVQCAEDGHLYAGWARVLCYCLHSKDRVLRRYRFKD